MDSALVALKKQQELRLNKIQRLEESLASKREVIQSCQEMADGPLRDVFRMDGVNHSFEDSMPIELLQLLRMKRSERRKRVLDRLTPIIGRTIDSGFLPNLNQDSSSSAVSSPTQPIRTLECVSGWLKTATRKILWIGAHIENQSDQVLSNLYLTISQYNCSGQKLPQVVPQSTGLVVILVQIDSSDQNESTNRSRVEMELNSSTVRLHVEQTLDQNVIQYSVLMTNIRLVDNCPNIWRSALVENILPYKVGCRLDNIANARLLVLIQDVFSLSPNEDYTVFGSLEEGIIAKISPAANSMQGTSWDVSFQVGTEAAAHDCARRSSLLCPRFAGDRIG
ncbi:hypothetical protein BGZ76_005340 [Entomortierella beljakovae]|nr:hypothetical protein BGZ76_005340 [Entomortierella beljakovae]